MKYQPRYYIGGSKILTPEELQQKIEKESWDRWAREERSVVMPSARIPKYDLPKPARYVLMRSLLVSFFRP